MKRLKPALRSAAAVRLCVHVLLTLAALGGFARVCATIEREQILPMLAAFAAAYLVLVLLLELLLRLPGRVGRKEMNEEMRSQLGSVNLDFIISLRQPVLITEEGGKIIWFNSHLSALVEKPSRLYGMPFESLTGFALRVILDNSESGTPFSLGDRRFLLRASALQVRSKRFLVTVFEDRTELAQALQEKEDETALLAFVVIDNLDELTEFAQNRTRSAVSEVENKLEHWAEELGGVWKEYEREKYLLIFDKRHLARLEEGKFEILDQIRQVRVGEGGLPMTISIGISRTPGTPAARAAASASCLDMALQRGGDQVVVRNEDGSLDFFGGKTKTVQKRTRVRARMMALNLLAQISASSDVLVMMHRFPDFDAIGAALGIMRLCRFCGVEVHLIVNPDDPNFVRCLSRIRHLPEYRDGSLFLRPSQAQERLGPDTLLVIVDVNNRKELECPEIADMVPGHKTVYVDHHRKTAEFTEKPIIEYIEPSASSACELITEMIEQTMQSGILQKEEADVMYAGITLDTKQFVRNTGTRNFSAALFLRGEGAIPSDAQALFKTDIGDFLSEAQYENGVTLYRDHFALAVSEADGSDDGVRLAASKAADKLLSVEGIRASFALCRIGDGVRISARSDGEVNVQRIMERLGGGGHFDASAAFLAEATMEQAQDLLKEAIDEQIDH